MRMTIIQKVLPRKPGVSFAMSDAGEVTKTVPVRRRSSIEKILMMGSKTSSLDTPVGEDGDTTLGETLASMDACTDALAERKNCGDVYERVMRENLTKQERDILKLYYGFSMDSDLNLKEIAPMVGLSKERVRQLKETALAKLRNNNASALLNEAA